MKKPRKSKPKTVVRQRAQATPDDAVEAVPKKARAAVTTKRQRPRPQNEPGVRTYTAGPKLNAIIGAFEWKHERVMALGSWSRKRAGVLVLAFLLSLALWWDWLAHHIAKPTILANCETIAYARVVAVDRACRSAEHCTLEQISDAEAAELVFDVVAANCFKAEPWSPHRAVYQAGVSVYDAGVWVYESIQDEPEKQDTPVQDESAEEVVIAETA